MPRIVKKCLIILGLLILITGAIAVFAHTKLPSIADKNFRETIAALGFNETTIPTPQSRFGALRYHDIALDKDGRNEITAITLHYGAFDLLLRKTIKSMEIHGLSLSGEVDQSGKLTLTGIETPRSLLALRQSSIRKISLKNATLSILSAHLGGIRINADLQIKQSKKTASWSGHLQSKQDQFEIISKIIGRMDANGNWQSNFEIENGKLERGFGKIARLSGSAKLEGTQSALTQISSDIRAGSMILSGLPWQQASITINGSPQDLRIFTSGKSIGFDGLELAGETRIKNILQDNQALGWNTRIHAEKIENALNLLEAQKLLPLPRKNLNLINKETNIEFGTSRAAQGLKFNINNAEKNIDIKGLIKEIPGKSKTIQFTSAPLSMGKMNTLSSFINEGQMLLSGVLTIKDNQADGTIKAEIKDAALKRGAITLRNMSGALVIDDLKTFSASKDAVLTCSDASAATKENCKLTLRLKNGKLNIQNAAMNIFGGTLTISPPKAKNRQTILLDKIDFAALLENIGIPGIKAKGRLNGAITFSRDAENGKTTIHSTVISNDGDGWIKMSSPALLALWDGNKFEKETAALALKNYHFETLSIKASGPLNGDMNIQINTHGRNPDILGKRPIMVNVKTKTSLAPFLGAVIQPPETPPEN